MSLKNHIALSLVAMKRHVEAEPLYREVLQVRQVTLGKESWDTVTSIESLGNCLRAQGKLREAEPYLREALESHRRMRGDEHPRTIWLQRRTRAGHVEHGHGYPR